MASNQDLRLSEVEVHRSGDLYLVSRGDAGRLVNVATGWSGRVGRVATIQRMASVAAPWSAVPLASCPPAVLAAARSLPDSPPSDDD